MSIYKCIHLTENAINSAESRLSIEHINPKNLEEITEKNKIIEDILFLKALKEQLIGPKDRQEVDFANIINQIHNYLDSKDRTFKNSILSILTDIEAIQKKVVLYNRGRPNKNNFSNNSIYNYYQSDRYRIFKFDQSDELISTGHCYGFVSAMADKNISPLHNPEKYQNEPFTINQMVYDYQSNVSNRERDQKIIKKTRLTRVHLCPDIADQAMQIFDFCRNMPDKELLLVIRGENVAHACYLSWQKNRKGLIYVDPNCGAYFFDNIEEFSQFYQASFHVLNYKFHSFQLSELIWDPDNKIPEKKTWSGVVRSILTGTKYSENNDNADKTRIMSSILFLLLFGIPIVISVFLFPVFLSAIPVAVLFASVLVINGSGALLGLYLSNRSLEKGFSGLLAIPNLFLYTWHNFKQKYFAKELGEPITNMEEQKNDVYNQSTKTILNITKKQSNTIDLYAAKADKFKYMVTSNVNSAPKEEQYLLQDINGKIMHTGGEYYKIIVDEQGNLFMHHPMHKPPALHLNDQVLFTGLIMVKNGVVAAIEIDKQTTAKATAELISQLQSRKLTFIGKGGCSLYFPNAAFRDSYYDYMSKIRKKEIAFTPLVEQANPKPLIDAVVATHTYLNNHAYESNWLFSKFDEYLGNNYFDCQNFFINILIQMRDGKHSEEISETIKSNISHFSRGFRTDFAEHLSKISEALTKNPHVLDVQLAQEVITAIHDVHQKPTITKEEEVKNVTLQDSSVDNYSFFSNQNNFNNIKNNVVDLHNESVNKGNKGPG